MKLLVEFNLDCGRMGDLSGLFVTTKKDLDKLYGRQVYFGEVLGKHSDIAEKMDKKMFKVKSDDQEFITKLEKIIGRGTISGYNPFDYFEEEDA